MYHYTDCGLPNIYLRGGFDVLDTEEGDAVAIHNLAGLHKAIGLDLVHHMPALTGDAVRFLRKEMNLTQNTFANIIGVSEDSVRGWENGRGGGISSPADKLLRGLYLEHVNGDGGLREMTEEVARLVRELAEIERRDFEKCDDDWCLAA
ncbi:MAG TPA: helix-turn-helix domain-containing protein [Acidiferrobacteraceae bacterium]|nr:helix-turn-helix domain-containing protein [Acidiferrobacteraceae bacterium]HEX19948.1 helix-turn-helix domain-containing protein [Acidiferrobacteraceae bacterium]